MSVRQRASGRSHYNYFRDYDPAKGGYVEADPLGNSGGINLYQYAMGNPQGLIDAFGLSSTNIGTLINCDVLRDEILKRKEVYTTSHSKTTDWKIRDVFLQYELGVGIAKVDGVYMPVPGGNAVYARWLDQQLTTIFTKIQRTWREHIVEKICEWEVDDGCGGKRREFNRTGPTVTRLGPVRYKTLDQWRERGWGASVFIGNIIYPLPE